MQRRIVPAFGDPESWTDSGRLLLVPVGEAAHKLQRSTEWIRRITVRGNRDASPEELDPIAVTHRGQCFYSPSHVERVAAIRAAKYGRES